MASNPLNSRLIAPKPKRGRLTFGKGNAKLGSHVYTFSLPAGYTCPGAHTCLAITAVVRGKAKLLDGPKATLRCFSASAEVMYSSVRKSRWANYRALEYARTTDYARKSDSGASGMAALILASLPVKAKLVRVHVSGDFYRPEYLKAWLIAARVRPGTTFYAYTKSVSLVQAEHKTSNIPPNFVFTLSYGGLQDKLIESTGLQSARVFMSEAEAKAAGLPVDHDDSHAYEGTGDFGLLVHGVQAKGSQASKAREANRAVGEFTGYGAK